MSYGYGRYGGGKLHHLKEKTMVNKMKKCSGMFYYNGKNGETTHDVLLCSKCGEKEE